MHSAFNLTLVHNLFTCPPLPWGPTHQPYLHIYCFKIVPFIMLEILWNNCHTNVSRVMYPLFSVSLGQYRQRNFYLFDVKSFLEFYLGTFCKLEILNKFPFARYALTYGQRLEMCTCILQLKRHCFTLKGAGRGKQRLFVLRKSFFFSDRNPFVV